MAVRQEARKLVDITVGRLLFTRDNIFFKAILSTIFKDWYYPHFTCKETEAQQDY